jgi:putative transcriptional regulator
MTAVLDIPRLIRWRLNVVMADRRMSVKELAEKMGMNRVSISKLKASDEYPQISGETLNKLCYYLRCTPSDLIEYTADTEPPGSTTQE